MNVCYYCRVAYNDDFSLEMQKEEILRYAEHVGTVVGGYAESGSGMILERPELQRVTEVLLSGQAEMLIIKNIDRISRSYEMIIQYINLLTENGIELLCIEERYIFSDKGTYVF